METFARRLGALLLVAACAAPPSDRPPERPPAADLARPYALVLGTAQDGGLPQIGCRAACCERARSEPARARLVSSLLVVDPQSGKRWLFDASPDLRAQVELCRGQPPAFDPAASGPAGDARAPQGARPPLFDGVFLTHAHMGHYTGLAQLGPEAYGAAGLAVFASRQMGSFLRTNGPWSLLVRGENIALLSLENDLPIPLTGGLRVTPLEVPHRREFTDTLGFLIEGPHAALLYLPDIDKWERWDRRIEDLIARVDVALLDGTFFAAGELPGRDMDDIPHPFVSKSLERFAALPAAERAKIVFTHLNHSNPAADPESPAAAAIRAAGMNVAREGQLIGL